MKLIGSSIRPLMRVTVLAAVTAFCLSLLAGGCAEAQSGSGVLSFHHGNLRSGAYVVPGLTWATAPNLHRDTGFSGTVNGPVRAQPLYWRPAGAITGRVIVATETNDIYALDAITGAVAWHTTLGTPVPKTDLPCGNIDPVGVTGTPVIGPNTGTVYLEAAVLRASAMTRQVFALSLADGSVLPGWPVDVAKGLAALGVSFDPTLQNQHGALSLYAGQLIVPYGGNAGDCGAYHGYVVAVQLTTPGVAAVWKSRANKGGIWSIGGGAVADGDLFVATGNTKGATTWLDGEAVLRLSPSLQHASSTANFFTPTNWMILDADDKDLGSSNPLPINIGSSNLILTLGKDGNAYLLNRANLGGIGGQIAKTQISAKQIITEPAVYPGQGGALVALGAAGSSCPTSAQGLTVLLVTPATVQTAWCAAVKGNGAPITTTSDGTNDRIVWVTGAQGDNQIHGFRGDTGAVLFAGGGAGGTMSNLHHSTTILAAQSRLYVAGDNQLYAFTAQ